MASLINTNAFLFSGKRHSFYDGSDSCVMSQWFERRKAAGECGMNRTAWDPVYTITTYESFRAIANICYVQVKCFDLWFIYLRKS